MSLWDWILSLFKKKPKKEIKPYQYTPTRPTIEPVKEHREEKKTAAQIRKERIQAWVDKPYKGKAHKMPMAKFMNPEKYF